MSTEEVVTETVVREDETAEEVTTVTTEEVTVTEETVTLEEQQAAIKIQSAFRGMQAREKVKTMKSEQVIKNKKPVITEVYAESVGGMVGVDLSPRQLNRGDRKSLRFARVSRKQIQVSVCYNVFL